METNVRNKKLSNDLCSTCRLKVTKINIGEQIRQREHTCVDVVRNNERNIIVLRIM